MIEIDVNPEATRCSPEKNTSAVAILHQPSTSGASEGPETRVWSVDSPSSDIGVAIGAVVDSEEDSP